MGVVEGWRKGRSRNKHTNTVFRQIHKLSQEHNCVVHMRYVPSAENPADKPSHGVYPPIHLLLPFQVRSPHISSILTSSNPILTNAVSEVLIQNSDHSLPASSSNVEEKLRNMPLPPFLPPKRRPGPYPCNLTLKISSRHPHCLARDRLRCWLPAAPRGATGGE